MYAPPRLIRCQLPQKEDHASVLRVIPAGRLTSIITHHTAQAAPLVLDTGAHGIRKQSNENLPAQLQQRLHIPARVQASNMNCDLRDFKQLQLEVLWGELPVATLRQLHGFAACYAIEAQSLRHKSVFLLWPEQVAHMQRLFERLCASRPWLKPRLSGPWPPINFGEAETALTESPAGF